MTDITYTFELDLELSTACDCDRVGRATKAYVSPAQLARTHESELVRGELRCYCAELNGAMPVDATITSVTWQCSAPDVLFMSDASITGRHVSVKIEALRSGFAMLKMAATLSTGERRVQLYEVWVEEQSLFFAVSASEGPRSLTVP